jgi:PEP-CTERM motif
MNQTSGRLNMFGRFFAATVLGAITVGANASIMGGVTANSNQASFLDLSTPGMVTGGALYTNNALPYAAIPKNTAIPIYTVGTWLAAGPNNGKGDDAVVHFGAGTTFASFLWGSPDTYNTLLVTTGAGARYSFTSANFSTVVFNGDQSFASYIGFNATDGDTISTLTFKSSGNAFEGSNFSAVAPVPEPSTYALMLAGLGTLGFAARRRKSAQQAT